MVCFPFRDPDCQHFIESSDIQILVLGPSFKLPFHADKSAKRASYAAKAAASFVIEAAIWDFFSMNKLPYIIICPVNNWIDQRFVCAVTMFNRAAFRSVVKVEYNPPPARFL